MDLLQYTKNNSVILLQRKKLGIKRNMIVKKGRLLRIKDLIGFTNMINR